MSISTASFKIGEIENSEKGLKIVAKIRETLRPSLKVVIRGRKPKEPVEIPMGDVDRDNAQVLAIYLQFTYETPSSSLQRATQTTVDAQIAVLKPHAKRILRRAGLLNKLIERNNQ